MTLTTLSGPSSLREPFERPQVRSLAAENGGFSEQQAPDSPDPSMGRLQQQQQQQQANTANKSQYKLVNINHISNPAAPSLEGSQRRDSHHHQQQLSGGKHDNGSTNLLLVSGAQYQGDTLKSHHHFRLPLPNYQSNDQEEEGDEDDSGFVRPQRALTGRRATRARRWAWLAMKVVLVMLLVDLVVYYWPMSEPQVRVRPLAEAEFRPRPKFSGSWSRNEMLDEAECMFADQFHAPESMAWTRDRRAFYTGVEGGFILLVEPYEERWTVVARLNARQGIRDLAAATAAEGNLTGSGAEKLFCEHDTKLYGPRAEFEPRLVRLSRCSRPLGMRLSPTGSHLYASDPLSGLYRIDIQPGAAHPSLARYQVSRLLDFDGIEPAWRQNRNTTSEVLFADDIAVEWATNNQTNDIIYMTDCSQRLTVRYLIRLMMENDDTGRVLRYDTGSRQLTTLAQVTPVLELQSGQWDARQLSFPNGLELSANGSALIISDLNNRRLLMHHLRGPLQGTTHQLLWVPGYSDNVRRGLDLPDGRPTYWAGCGCAVSDGYFEVAEFGQSVPHSKTVLLKLFHFLGRTVEQLGTLLDVTSLRDGGLMLKALWLKHDPYCTHGLVFQFTEQGHILRSLHAPHFNSLFKLVSEAHEVELPTGSNNSSGSVLYLGSVYYPYLGRLKLAPLGP